MGNEPKEGVVLEKVVNGRVITVFPITFGRFRIGVGDGYAVDDLW